MYLLRLALRPWRLAPFSQILSALSVGILLLLTGFIAWVHNGIDTVIARFQSEEIVTVYLAPSVEKLEEKKVVDSIRTTLGAQSVSAIHYVSGDQFLSDLKEKYPELGNEVESLAATEADAIIPRFVSIAGSLPVTMTEALKKIPGVDQVESSKDRYTQVIVAYSALKWVARLFIVGLGLALLTGLVHLSRVNSHFYKDVLGFLRLWGANRFDVLVPGGLSGLGVGLIGGAAACAGWFFGSAWLAAQLRALSPVLNALPEISQQLGILLLVAGAALGMAGGLMASWWAASRVENRSPGAGGRAWL